MEKVLFIDWANPAPGNELPSGLPRPPLGFYYARCGHEGKCCQDVEVFGQIFTVRYTALCSQPAFCHECLKEFFRLCAKCRKVILPIQTVKLCGNLMVCSECGLQEDKEHLWIIGELSEVEKGFTLSL